MPSMHDDEQFIERPQSDDRAGDDPPTSAVAEHRSHNEQQRCRPDQEIDTGCQEHVTEEEGQRLLRPSPRL